MDFVTRSSVEALVAILVVLFGSIVVKLFRDLIWRPYAFQKAYAGQGIRGPPYRIPAGSVPEYTELLREAHAQPMQNISHDIVPRITPQYHKWCQIYGETFFYWYGIQSRLYISEPELIKEVLSNKFGQYEKETPRPFVLALLGRGLFFVDGLRWVNHRRIVSPVFNVDKLKVWILGMSYNHSIIRLDNGWRTITVC